MEEGIAVHGATMTASRAMLKGVSGLKPLSGLKRAPGLKGDRFAAWPKPKGKPDRWKTVGHDVQEHFR